MQEVKNDKNQKENQDFSIDENNEKPLINQEREEEINAPEKTPIYNVELIFIYPIVIIAEIVDCISWTGIGTPISWVLDISSMGIVTLWLLYKGRRVDYNAIAGALEFIPGIDIFPIRFVALTLLVLSERNDKVKNLTQKIQETSINKESITKK